jgi:acyl-CoA thioesterase
MPTPFQVAQSMFEADNASRGLGMHIVSVTEGCATLKMTVRADMTNGHQTCHGGIIFTLADSAFAFACNSRNNATVGAGCTIEYLAPAHEGDILTADARELILQSKSGIYDVIVTNQTGAIIATFRGRSHRLSPATSVLSATPLTSRDREGAV